jgi:hypothetical protein
MPITSHITLIDHLTTYSRQMDGADTRVSVTGINALPRPDGAAGDGGREAFTVKAQIYRRDMEVGTFFDRFYFVLALDGRITRVMEFNTASEMAAKAGGINLQGAG